MIIKNQVLNTYQYNSGQSFVLCSCLSSQWELFGHFTRSAFRRTPSLSRHSRATTLKYPCPSIYSQKRGEIYHLLLQFFTILKALFVKSSIGMLDIMVKVTFKIYVGQQMILPFFINFVNIFPPRICATINGISNLHIFGIKFRV